MRQLKIIATFACLSFVMSSCGKGGLSSDVSMSLLPQNPLVVNADFTIGSGEDARIIKNPWFENRYEFKNGTEQNMIVVTLKYTVTGYKNGSTTTKEYTVDPGADCEDGFERPYLAVVNPDDSVFIGLPPDGAGSNCWPEGSDFGAEPISVKPSYERIYPDTLPETDNNFYTVQVEALGWFEKPATREITERLALNAYFTTR